MKIQIVTENFKKTTRYVNIALLIFGVSVLVFFISFWFPNSEPMKSIGMISLFSAASLIISTIFLLILRQFFKKTIEISEDQIEAIFINSHIEVIQIKSKAEIVYFGNRLQTVGDSKIYEITNKTAFDLLRGNFRIKTSNISCKVRSLEIPPHEILKDVTGALFGWS